MRVLLIEDEPTTAKSIELMLGTEGFNVYTTDLGEEGIDLGKLYDYDIIVLDLQLPDMSGFEVLKALRVAKVQTPVLILSGNAIVEAKVKALGFGADDYMTKPFALQELSARLEVLARRGKGPQSRVLKVSDLTFNLDTLTVNREGKSIQLNPIGLKLLQALMEASPSVVTRQDLEQKVWGEELPDSDSLRVHIHGLRAAIDKPFEKPLIHTRHGIGYRMVDPDAVQA